MSTTVGNMLVRKTIADVMRRKGRTLIVVLSIFVSVLGLTGINVFEFKLFDAFAFQQDRSRYPDIMLITDSIDPNITAQLVYMPNVKTLQTQRIGQFQWQTRESGTVQMLITAFPDPQHITLGGYVLTSGRMAGPGEIVMETGDTGLQPFTSGDTIHLSGPNGEANLRIVGTAQTAGLSQVKGTRIAQGYMSVAGLSALTGITQDNSIAIKVKDANSVHNTARMLTDTLQKQHISVHAVTIQSSIGSQMGADFLAGFFNLVRTLAAGALVVACFLLINTLTTLVTEQIRIIGTMKALGGTRGRIIMSYLLTVFVYAILGTIPGLVLGIVSGYLGAWRFAMQKGLDLGPFSLEPNIFIIGIIAGIGAPLLAALLPLWQGTHITVREALGSYGLSSGGPTESRWSRWVAERLIWVPQTVWLGFRGIFRRRGRAFMTVLALALSGVTFLAVMTVTYSIDQMIPHLTDNYGYDVLVSTDPLPFQRLQQPVATLANVVLIEPSEIIPVKTQWGVLDLQGVLANTQIYHKPLTSGRWFAPGEANVVVLDEQSLQNAHLTVGDSLSFTDENGHAAVWKIIGAVNDTSPIVGANGIAITSVENVNLVAQKPAGTVNQIYIQARDHAPDKLDQMVIQVRQALQKGRIGAAVVTKQRQAADEQHSALSLYVVFFVAALGVALVGILGLYNTLTSSVLERQREIGIWRAMGASGRQVARVFWLEGMVLAGLAWLLCLIIGLPVAYGFVRLVSQWLFIIPFAFDPKLLILMLVALGIVATIACFGPMTRASHTRIAEILRYE